MITGVGARVPNANNAKTLYDNLNEGISSIKDYKYNPNFEWIQNERTTHGSFFENLTFDSKKYGLHKKIGIRPSNAIKIAIESSHEALVDANIVELGQNKSKLTKEMGIGLNTVFGSIKGMEYERKEMEENLTFYKSPYGMQTAVHDGISGSLVRLYQCGIGPAAIYGTACQGLSAIISGIEKIILGKANYYLSGGVDACGSKLGYKIFAAAAGPLIKNIDIDLLNRTIIPFDKDRKGTLVGEGAAFLFLEHYDEMNPRKDVIPYAEVMGYLELLDQNSSNYAKSVEDVSNLGSKIRNYLDDLNIKEKIGVIYAHATGTRSNDAMEANLIKNVFGDRANELYITGTKTGVAHTMGAAASLDVVTACMSTKNKKINHIIGLEDPIDGLNCVMDKPKERNSDYTMIISNGHFGRTSILILGPAPYKL